MYVERAGTRVQWLTAEVKSLQASNKWNQCNKGKQMKNKNKHAKVRKESA